MTVEQMELRSRLATAICPVHGLPTDADLRIHLEHVALTVEDARVRPTQHQLVRELMRNATDGGRS